MENLFTFSGINFLINLKKAARRAAFFKIQSTFVTVMFLTSKILVASSFEVIEKE